MSGCGCKKRRLKPAVQSNPSKIKLTENPKPTEKKAISDVERNIINQIANDLKEQTVLN